MLLSASGYGRMRRRGELAESSPERRTGDAAFSEDGGEVAGGGDVEGGVRGVNVRSNADALEMRDFGGGTLLDGNVISVREGEIERGDWRGDIEGHVVLFGEHGNLVGTDFVGGVAVGGDAVGAREDGAGFSGLQGVAHPGLGVKCERDAAPG